MPQIVAAVCYAQLKNAKKIVRRRKMVAKYFSDAIKNSKCLIEQLKPKGRDHTHYTFSARYFKKKNFKWKDLYNSYKSKTGNGFYGACVCPHLEPSIKSYMKTSKGTLPVSEKIQKQIIQFKTNYRDLREAKKNAIELKKILEKIDRQ